MALLKHDELARLEADRRRLVAALEAAEASGPTVQTEAAYIAART